MIRKFESKDLEKIMEIWLSTNIQAHNFIPKGIEKQLLDKIKEYYSELSLTVCKKT